MKADRKISTVDAAALGAFFIAIALSAAMIFKAIPVRNDIVATVLLLGAGAAVASIVELRKSEKSRPGRRAAMVVLFAAVVGYVLFGCVWTYFALKYGW